MITTEPDELDHQEFKGGNFDFFIDEDRDNKYKSKRPVSYQKAVTQTNNLKEKA